MRWAVLTIVVLVACDERLGPVCLCAPDAGADAAAPADESGGCVCE